MQINRHAVEIAGGVLVNRLDVGVSEAGQRGGIGRMHMQNAARLRQLRVHGAMNGPGRRVGRIGLVHSGFIIGIEQQQVTGLDAGKMFPARVHQKGFAIRRDSKTEMIGHSLVHVQFSGEAEGGGKVNAQLGFAHGFGLVNVHGVLSRGLKMELLCFDDCVVRVPSPFGRRTG